MINSMARVVLTILALALLAACSHPIITPQGKPQQKACTLSCEQKARACNKVCRNNCAQCTAYNFQTAAKNFNHYFHESAVNGQIIKRDLNSYFDPLQCRKTTCNCRGDYVACVQSCGGVVKKRLQAAAVC
ncbi:acyltransferase [Legionella taurinensis]|uniref:Acyltransferase n=2 Tax=Legionella taurinensis TaxID=70611 RepID=A0A3A5LA76_9GAMM|nr:acyltransferase [Legionella taurinensis]MDX1837147.1 acyltransferase [Legionella taurinensis]PUT40373.1 acyltransferase [Legionella taurinensis]PUT40536.1 acyltransferase [Legionella taurinensis]PUT42781.1 acyltransferase [Legionella taurinensis]PUT48434.1 acyltransferase [Legionella taurinensis]